VLYRIAADAVILIHFAFIVFALAGGMLVFKWRWMMWLHIPAAIWAAVIIMFGWICPLTPLENMLRQAAGVEAYTSGFIERYLLPAIYPSGLDRGEFIVMGIMVIAINVIVYALLYRKPKI